ncbi:VENN motif pre-toxin domain-containing protein [Formosimonas limnophila]
MASQAITGLLASAAGGNLQQGIANAAAPLLASQVGDYFDRQPDTEANNAARLLTHAAVGAAVAYLSGNDAASGAAGAVTGEALAQIIIKEKYDGKTSDQLTTAEKEDIRAISTLAATLVGGITGGSFEDAVTAGAAGYNAVVNNGLTTLDKVLNNDLKDFTEEEREAINQGCIPFGGSGSPMFCAGFGGITKVLQVRFLSLVKTDSYLLKQAKSLSQKESAGINKMLEQIAKGNMNPGIGTKVFDGITEFRHVDGGRIYGAFKDGVFQIFGYSGKANQPGVIDRIKKLFF